MEKKVENQMLEMMKQMNDQMENMNKRMTKMDNRVEKGFAAVDKRLGDIQTSIKNYNVILYETTEENKSALYNAFSDK